MSTQLENDIDTLKKDLGKFRDDITSVLFDVGHFSQDKVSQTKEKLTNAMRDFEGVAAKKFTHANEIVREKAEKGVKASRQIVTQRPLAAVAISFAAGALTVFLLRKNHE